MHIPWRDDHEPVPNDVCERRAREAVGSLVRPSGEVESLFEYGEHLLQNGFLMTPMEMNQFVDSFGSEQVRVHFDTGNISMFQFAEHWCQSWASAPRISISKSLPRRVRTILTRDVPSATRWHDQLARRDGWLGVGRLRGLCYLRVLPSLSALS